MSGRIGTADPADAEAGQRDILGVVESHAVEGRRWIERRADRLGRPAAFMAQAGAGRSPLDVGRARLILNARRRYTHPFRNSMEVRRMLREGDVVTLVIDIALRAGGDGYRSPAAPPVTPVAIFAGSTGWARWRLVRETAWLLAPFVLITAMWGWAMYTGMQLEQASADAQCAE